MKTRVLSPTNTTTKKGGYPTISNMRANYNTSMVGNSNSNVIANLNLGFKADSNLRTSHDSKLEHNYEYLQKAQI